jgi:hypothetical protein
MSSIGTKTPCVLGGKSMSERRITRLVGLALGGLFAFGLLLNALAM